MDDEHRVAPVAALELAGPRRPRVPRGRVEQLQGSRTVPEWRIARTEDDEAELQADLEGEIRAGQTARQRQL